MFCNSCLHVTYVNVMVAHSIVVLRRIRYIRPLLCVNNAFKPFNCQKLVIKRICSQATAAQPAFTMEPVNNEIFDATRDHFSGVAIHSNVINKPGLDFETVLNNSLTQWTSESVRAVWCHIEPECSHWIPILIKHKFQFHRANPASVTLLRWLPNNEVCTVPSYAHTMVGIGAIVHQPESDSILVVRERFNLRRHFWKLPGGYVDPGEALSDAVVREIREETGIAATFLGLVSVRHLASEANFGCGDLYFVAHLQPDSTEIKTCPREIAECRWMKIQEFLVDPNVHSNNKLLLQSFLTLKSSPYVLNALPNTPIHPITGLQQHFFCLQPRESAPES